ncbi:MAG TPA: DASS family sodium-coupled anion symporter [Candidatus Acidoferrales bacterium]|nr:DASS family sodium-coupled anion symporter [Candidatus Acidoferrales bacterium]
MAAISQAPSTTAAANGSGWRWAAVLIPGALLYFFPLPGLNPQQARVFGVFVATVIALVAQPVRMGVSVLLAMTLLALTGTLSAARVLSGFSNVTVWLIFTAFLFSRAVTQTGFGMRVGYLFIERFARTPLRLGYSMAAADLVLAPFIPSDTARGGGVVFPVTRSVAKAFGSEPGPTAHLMGSFLMLVSFHTTYTASAMFLTGMASNPLIADFARNIGHVELTWIRWFTGSSVPGFLALVIIPWLLLRLATPEIRDTGPARELARRELAHMGPLRREEKWLVAIMSGVMAGWVTSPLHGVPNTFVALTGLCALLLARVISWDDLLDERRAWDTLIWFAPIIMMSDVMSENGSIRVLSGHLFHLMSGWAWPAVFVAIVLSYCYVHYGFASMTAQVTALYPAFFGAALAGGVPPLMAALALAYFSNLNAAMTHYGTGSAPVFFGAGYVRQGEWWRIGFLISLVQAAIWLGLGSMWWRFAL